MSSSGAARIWRPLVAVLVLLCAPMVGCVDQADENPLATVVGRERPTSGDEPSIPPGAGPEDVIEAALDEVEAYWSRTFPDIYGTAYEPIRGGFFPYGPDSPTIPCGPGLSYDEIAENAFYCPSDDLIAWDEVRLTPPLFSRFGGFTLGIVFAHEIGHAVQARAVDDQVPTVILELQADCFAGAWTADVADGGSDFFTVSRDGLDASVAGFISLRDGAGVVADDPQAHGTGFDRVGAFQDGLDRGAARCAEYPDDPPSVFEFGFTSQSDFSSGGNLPFRDVAPFTVEDLEAFWDFTFTELGFEWDAVDDVVIFDPETDEVTCGDHELDTQEVENAAFYCVPDDSVQLDGANLLPELYEIGDFAMGFEIARQYAFAAQVRLGDDEDDDEDGLQADCFVGAYVASTLPGVDIGRERTLVSSPGDLDEAIISFLSAAEDGGVSAFERVGAFRTGVLGFGDLSVCDP